MTRSASAESPLVRARKHLARRDPILKPVLTRIGSCTLLPGGDPFTILVRAIVAQVVSTKAAETIYARLAGVVGAMTPEQVLATGTDPIRGAGLSRAKVAAILDLAERARDGRLPLARFPELTDEELVASLTAVRGIGVWTAEMFLIFGLGRLDILPVGDFGLRAGVQELYALEDLPRPAKLREIATSWAPYRSVATWYIWRSRGPVPQS